MSPAFPASASSKRDAGRSNARSAWSPAPPAQQTADLAAARVGQPAGHQPRPGDDDRVEELVLDVCALLADAPAEALVCELTADTRLSERGVRTQRDERPQMLFPRIDAVGADQQQPMGSASFAVPPVGQLADRTRQPFRWTRRTEH